LERRLERLEAADAAGLAVGEVGVVETSVADEIDSERLL
jgi:hypothetical protein